MLPPLVGDLMAVVSLSIVVQREEKSVSFDVDKVNSVANDRRTGKVILIVASLIGE